jgi:hypothetical protein
MVFHMRAAVILLLLLFAGSGAAAQEQPASLASDNPLAAMKDELSRALAAASVPFSEEQERAVVLMMEERRRASEDLFGDLLDFSSGPTSGENADRLKSAIEWMRTEFSTRIQAFLTDEQRTVWNGLVATQAAAATAEAARTNAPPPQQTQTQLVRINNNSFTAERFFFGNAGTEVIPRGGIGAWHGNVEYTLQDEALNARNPFASNKPPYQERELNFNVGGPAIARRLTTSFNWGYNRSENVGTVRATLPTNEIFALGITRPQVSRYGGAQTTLQIAEGHSLRANLSFTRNHNENQNIGGFTLPERASEFRSKYWQADVRQFSQLGPNRLYETRVNTWHQRNENIPLSEAVRINVLDAFQSGGAQNRNVEQLRTVEVSNLYSQYGERMTFKAGTLGTFRQNRAVNTNNFYGTFTFSSLDAYRAGTPLNYRITRGDPELLTRQFELGGFVQTDLKITQQLTLMLGLRYDGQTNVDDYGMLQPRVSFAYGLGAATVLRGGLGLYHERLGIGEVITLRRFDGTRQFEIVVDNPTYPDPFLGGSVRQSVPSIRVLDPSLQTPESVLAMISVERTLWRNLLTTVTYQFEPEWNRFRLRNLNAPYDATSATLRACQPGQSADTCVRPNPEQGQIANLESTARERRQSFNASARQRFSFMNVEASYAWGLLERDAPFTTLPTDNFDLRSDWARDDDPSHSFDLEVNARLPLGIFLTGEMESTSGRYYTITTGRDDNRDSNSNDRPAGVPRNGAIGPRYLNFDFNVSKAVFLGMERAGTPVNVNLFANLRNAFNRTHYGTPSGVMTSPNFGRSTSADDPREIEMGIRFQF